MPDTITIAFSSQAQGAANNVHGYQALSGLTLVGVSVYVEAFTGAPAGFSVDVNVAGATAIAAVAANTAGQAGAWKSAHFGGSAAPVGVAAGQLVTIDVNFTGGTTPTADYDVVLHALPGTV